MHKFVSCVPGRLVTRLGSTVFIGAEMTATGPEFQENVVVALSSAEWDRYGSTYEKHLRVGDLQARTQEDFDSYLQAEEEAEAKKVAAQKDGE